jgi:hypothetical protein
MVRNKVYISKLLSLTIIYILFQGCNYLTPKTAIPGYTEWLPYTQPTSTTPSTEVMIFQSTVMSSKSIIATPTIYKTPINRTAIASFTDIMEATQAPTLTPLPTIPDSGVQAYLRDLLLNNIGCRLPCWWGITPGVTDWQTAQQFLQTFTSDISHDDDKPDLYNETHGKIKNGYIFGITQYYINENGKVISIIAGPTDTDIGYKLSQLLENYGEPDEVEIYTYPYYLSHGQLPLYLFIRYDKETITAIYEYEAEIIGNEIRVCPGFQTVGPRLILGEPQTPFDIQSYPKQPLITATNKSIADFHKAFVNPNSQVCLRTPKNIWEWP